MVTDQSGLFCGESSRRMFKYLTLCKVDMLIRKTEDSVPSCRVDQPGKAGQARTITQPSNLVKSTRKLRLDHNLKTGSRDQTLNIKREMARQSGMNIQSLSEVGTVILQQDNTDLVYLPVYQVTHFVDNFANQCKEWKFCLILNRQESWVSAFYDLCVENRLQVDYLMVVNYGQIMYYKVQ